MVDTSKPAIGSATRSDREAIRRMFLRLSQRTVYDRFLGFVKNPGRALWQLTSFDGTRRVAVVARVAREVVGIAQFSRDAADPARAEIAILVEDAWQGRGIGSALLLELTSVARAHGVTALTASVHAENARALRLLRANFSAVALRASAGEYAAEIPVAA